MGLTKQEKLDRTFDKAVKTKRKWELITSIKAEASSSTADMIDELVDLLTNKTIDADCPHCGMCLQDSEHWYKDKGCRGCGIIDENLLTNKN